MGDLTVPPLSPALLDLPGVNAQERTNVRVNSNDFIHKIGVVEKEASETQYWLELFGEANIGDPNERRWLLQESGELLAIFTASGRMAKSRRAGGSR